MKIDFNPHAAAQTQSARGPQVQTTPPVPEGSDDGVTVTLSQAAKQMLKGDADYSGKSPAQMARAALLNEQVAFAEGQDASTTPFGQIVKTFAPGHNKAPEVTEEPGTVTEDGGETAPVDETAGSGETGETGTTDGGDTAVAEGSDDTGETATTDGGDTTVAEGSDGSGDTTVAEGSDDTGETATTDGGDTTVVAAPEAGDGTGIGETDPVVVVEEPDITEVLDESAPTDGETTDPESGMAGSGDAVASTGDGEASDGGTIGDAGEPVAVVDAGDVTDELLDQLDENSEEVV